MAERKVDIKMDENIRNEKSMLDLLHRIERFHSGEKVLCDNCKKGYYEVVDGGKVIAGYKCNKCGSFIHITPRKYNCGIVLYSISANETYSGILRAGFLCNKSGAK